MWMSEDRKISAKNVVFYLEKGKQDVHAAGSSCVEEAEMCEQCRLEQVIYAYFHSCSILHVDRLTVEVWTNRGETFYPSKGQTSPQELRCPVKDSGGLKMGSYIWLAWISDSYFPIALMKKGWVSQDIQECLCKNLTLIKSLDKMLKLPRSYLASKGQERVN